MTVPLVESEFLLSVKFRKIWPSLLTNRHEKQKFEEDVDNLLPVRFSQNPFVGLREVENVENS